MAHHKRRRPATHRCTKCAKCGLGKPWRDAPDPQPFADWLQDAGKHWDGMTTAEIMEALGRN